MAGANCAVVGGFAGAQNDYSDRTFDHSEFIRARRQNARMKSANAPEVRTVIAVPEQPNSPSGLGLRLSHVAHLRLSGSERYRDCMGLYLPVRGDTPHSWMARYRHISRPYVVCKDEEGRWTVAKLDLLGGGDKGGVELPHDDVSAETPDRAAGAWQEAVLERSYEMVR